MRTEKELQKIVDGMTDEQYRRVQFPWNRLPEHNIIAEIKADKTGVDMSVQFRAVEAELLEYGIEIKIRNFSEFEGATQMLNRIEYDLNNI